MVSRRAARRGATRQAFPRPPTDSGGSSPSVAASTVSSSGTEPHPRSLQAAGPSPPAAAVMANGAAGLAVAGPSSGSLLGARSPSVVTAAFSPSKPSARPPSPPVEDDVKDQDGPLTPEEKLGVAIEIISQFDMASEKRELSTAEAGFRDRLLMLLPSLVAAVMVHDAADPPSPTVPASPDNCAVEDDLEGVEDDGPLTPEVKLALAVKIIRLFDTASKRRELSSAEQGLREHLLMLLPSLEAAVTVEDDVEDDEEDVEDSMEDVESDVEDEDVPLTPEVKLALAAEIIGGLNWASEKRELSSAELGLREHLLMLLPSLEAAVMVPEVADPSSTTDVPSTSAPSELLPQSPSPLVPASPHTYAVADHVDDVRGNMEDVEDDVEDVEDDMEDVKEDMEDVEHDVEDGPLTPEVELKETMEIISQLDMASEKRELSSTERGLRKYLLMLLPSLEAAIMAPDVADPSTARDVPSTSPPSELQPQPSVPPAPVVPASPQSYAVEDYMEDVEDDMEYIEDGVEDVEDDVEDENGPLTPEEKFALAMYIIGGLDWASERRELSSAELGLRGHLLMLLPSLEAAAMVPDDAEPLSSTDVPSACSPNVSSGAFDAAAPCPALSGTEHLSSQAGAATSTLVTMDASSEVYTPLLSSPLVPTAPVAVVAEVCVGNGATVAECHPSPRYVDSSLLVAVSTVSSSDTEPHPQSPQAAGPPPPDAAIMVDGAAGIAVSGPSSGSQLGTPSPLVVTATSPSSELLLQPSAQFDAADPSSAIDVPSVGSPNVAVGAFDAVSPCLALTGLGGHLPHAPSVMVADHASSSLGNTDESPPGLPSEFLTGGSSLSGLLAAMSGTSTPVETPSGKGKSSSHRQFMVTAPCSGWRDCDGTRFDASQYAFFSNNVLEEIELGALEDGNDSSASFVGLDDEVECSLSSQENALKLVFQAEDSSFSDVDDLANTFSKLRRDINLPEDIGINNLETSFSRESYTAADWAPKFESSPWPDQYVLGVKQGQDGNGLCPPQHHSSHPADSRFHGTSSSPRQEQHNRDEPVSGPRPSPLHRTSSYPQKEPQYNPDEVIPAADVPYISHHPLGGPPNSLPGQPHWLNMSSSFNGFQMLMSAQGDTPFSQFPRGGTPSEPLSGGNLGHMVSTGFPTNGIRQQNHLLNNGQFPGETASIMPDVVSNHLQCRNALVPPTMLQMRQQHDILPIQHSSQHLSRTQAHMFGLQQSPQIMNRFDNFGTPEFSNPRARSSMHHGRYGHRFPFQGSEFGTVRMGYSRPRFRSKYMSTEELDNISRIQHAATHINDPYIDDYYHQACLARRYVDARLKYHFFPTLIQDPSSRACNKDEPHAYLKVDALGRLPFSSIQRPRPLLDVEPSSTTDNNTLVSKPHDQEPMLAARVTIEDGLSLLLDIDDIDRLLQFSQQQDGGLQLRNRRQALLDRLAESLQLVDPLGPNKNTHLSANDDLIFLRIISLPKGRKLLSRYINLVVPGSDLARIVCMAVFRHLRYVFGNLPSDDASAETVTKLAGSVAACTRGMDLSGLSACLAAIVCSTEHPPLRPLGYASGDGATVIIKSVLDRATELLTEHIAASNCSVPNRSLWQASFNAFFGLLAKYCISKFDILVHTMPKHPAAATAITRELPIELLRASLPHTDEHQRRLLLEFAQRTVPVSSHSSHGTAGGTMASETVLS